MRYNAVLSGIVVTTRVIQRFSIRIIRWNYANHEFELSLLPVSPYGSGSIRPSHQSPVYLSANLTARYSRLRAVAEQC
jgi:hypothetical protein